MHLAQVAALHQLAQRLDELLPLLGRDLVPVLVQGALGQLAVVEEGTDQLLDLAALELRLGRPVRLVLLQHLVELSVRLLQLGHRAGVGGRRRLRGAGRGPGQRPDRGQRAATKVTARAAEMTGGRDGASWTSCAFYIPVQVTQRKTRQRKTRRTGEVMQRSQARATVNDDADPRSIPARSIYARSSARSRGRRDDQPQPRRPAARARKRGLGIRLARLADAGDRRDAGELRPQPAGDLLRRVLDAVQRRAGPAAALGGPVPARRLRSLRHRAGRARRAGR